MLYPVNSVAHMVDGHLLASYRTGQVPKVLNHGALPSLKRSRAGFNLLELTLDALLAGLTPLQVLKDQVLGVVGRVVGSTKVQISPASGPICRPPTLGKSGSRPLSGG